MVRYCSAYGCFSSDQKSECRAKSFFGFPLKNKPLTETWVSQMRRKDFVATSASLLCSDHFEEECFTYQPFTNRRQLKPGSVPTKFSVDAHRKHRRKLLLPNDDNQQDADDPDDPDMRKCALCGCGEKDPKTGVSLHRFPVHKEHLLQDWLDVVNTNGFLATKNSYLCSRHFKPEDIEGGTRKKTRLKPDAVPSLYLQPHESVKKKKRVRNRKRTVTLANIARDHSYCYGSDPVTDGMQANEETDDGRFYEKGQGSFSDYDFVNPWQSHVIEACFLVPVICDLGEDA